MGEEVEGALWMKQEKGRRTAKFFTNSKEIIFCPGNLLSVALPTGVRIEVILGHVEAVSVVWVTPFVKVDGVKACMEMVDKISKLLANQDHLIPVESPGSVRTGCCTGAGWGREGWLSSLILVWGGDSTLYSALDRLVDLLA